MERVGWEKRTGGQDTSAGSQGRENHTGLKKKKKDPGFISTYLMEPQIQLFHQSCTDSALVFCSPHTSSVQCSGSPTQTSATYKQDPSDVNNNAHEKYSTEN